MLVAVRNYARLDTRIHRGAQPLEGFEYAWLAGMGVKTLVNLRAESRHDEVYVAKHGLRVRTLEVEDHCAPTMLQAQQFLDILRTDPSAFYLHCHHGHGRTSTFSVLARLAQGWTVESAIAEEAHRFGYAFEHPCQVDFLHEAAQAIQKGTLHV